VVRVSEMEGGKRFDAEYHSPENLHVRQVVAESSFPVRSLGEISESIINFGAYSLCNSITFQDEGVRFITAREIHENFINWETARFIPADQHADLLWKSQIRKGQVLISMAGRLGVSCVFDETFACNSSQDVAKITLKAGLNPYYISTFLNSKFGAAQLLGAQTGSVQQHTNLGIIKTIRVVVLPKLHQERIETLVKRANAATEASRSLYAEAQALLAAELGLDRLDLSESLYSVRRASEVHTSSRADAEYYRRRYLNLLAYLDEKPHNTLAELATFSGGATPLGADYLDAGIPFLRIQNVGENHLVLDDVVCVDQEAHSGLLRRSQLAPRDVLITITGRIGTSAVVPDELAQANINQHIVRMRLKSKAVNPYYLAAFLNSVGGKLQTEREAYGTTRDALPYYCLAKIRVLKADARLQGQIEQVICKADETSRDAKRLLAEAKAEVERMIEGGAGSDADPFSAA